MGCGPPCVQGACGSMGGRGGGGRFAQRAMYRASLVTMHAGCGARGVHPISWVWHTYVGSVAVGTPPFVGVAHQRRGVLQWGAEGGGGGAPTLTTGPCVVGPRPSVAAFPATAPLLPCSHTASLPCAPSPPPPRRPRSPRAGAKQGWRNPPVGAAGADGQPGRTIRSILGRQPRRGVRPWAHRGGRLSRCGGCAAEAVEDGWGGGEGRGGEVDTRSGGRCACRRPPYGRDCAGDGGGGGDG